MAAQGAPDIKRYFGESDEGFIYVHIDNQDSEATYSENVDFTMFDNLQFLKPEQGSSYQIKVGPNSSKTVIVK
jgi:hypothetical protein